MPHSIATLGAQFAPPYHRPHLRYIEATPGAEAGTPPAQAAVEPAEQVGAPPADPPAGEEIDYKAKYEETLRHSRTWETRAKENSDKAKKFDEAETAKLSEIEREKKRAEEAEQKSAVQAAELLQLRVANENGITKEERALLTGATEEVLTAQVAAILGLRAPSTASAQAAGITGGGKPTATAPASMEAALTAHFAAKGK